MLFRAIYEPGRDVHKFMGALERKIHHYDKDIERLCNQHYSGFIETVRELVTVKQQCRMLRVSIWYQRKWKVYWKFGFRCRNRFSLSTHAWMSPANRSFPKERSWFVAERCRKTLPLPLTASVCVCQVCCLRTWQMSNVAIPSCFSSGKVQQTAGAYAKETVCLRHFGREW